MAKFSFYLHDKSKVESLIFLSIIYPKNRIKLKTKQKVKPKAWNDESKSIRNNYTESVVHLEKSLFK